MAKDYITLDEAVLDAGFKTKSIIKFPTHIKPNLERVKLADVRIARMVDTDKGVQRMMTTVAEKIYLGFDPRYFMYPLIGKRKDGSLYALDGGNRLIAVRAGGVEYVDCVVIESDDERDDADAFLTINAERKGIKSIVKSWAKHISGNDPVATRFFKCIKTAGFIHHEKKGYCRIKGSTGLNKAMVNYGDDNFTFAMLAYKAIWPSHDEVNNDVVEALSFMIWAYRKKNEPAKVTASALAKNIDGIMLPFALIPKLVNAGGKKFNHSDKNYQGTLVMIENYNKGLRGRKRLAAAVAEKAWESTKR